MKFKLSFILLLTSFVSFAAEKKLTEEQKASIARQKQKSEAQAEALVLRKLKELSTLSLTSNPHVVAPKRERSSLARAGQEMMKSKSTFSSLGTINEDRKKVSAPAKTSGQVQSYYSKWGTHSKYTSSSTQENDITITDFEE